MTRRRLAASLLAAAAVACAAATTGSAATVTYGATTVEGRSVLTTITVTVGASECPVVPEVKNVVTGFSWSRTTYYGITSGAVDQRSQHRDGPGTLTAPIGVSVRSSDAAGAGSKPRQVGFDRVYVLANCSFTGPAWVNGGGYCERSVEECAFRIPISVVGAGAEKPADRGPPAAPRGCAPRVGANRPPVVDAGPDARIALGAPLRSRARARDDGRPCGRLRYAWSVVEEPRDPWPGVAVVDDDSVVRPTFRFSEAGTYVLRLRVSDGKLSRTDTVEVTVRRPALPWPPLVANARDAFATALARGLRSRGYYNQVLNIVCAAAKDTSPACGPMRPYYALATGARRDWARDWVYAVFQSFLGAPTDVVDLPPELVAQAREAGCAALARLVPLVAPFAQAGCLATSTDEDFGALIAGMAHFSDTLAPMFERTIRARLRGSLKRVAMTRAADADGRRVLCASAAWIRTQHAALFRFAVAPGFVEVARNAGVSDAAGLIARFSVPAAAAALREQSLETAVEELGGRACSSR